MHMTPLTHLMMLGFIPVALNLFGKYPARLAVIIVFIGGWLLLPQAKYDIPLVSQFVKLNMLGLAVLVGVLSKDPNILDSFHISLIDIPMVCWCSAPFFSSLTNGLGVWDGFSSSLANILGWGLPYFIGRLYFGSLDGLRDLGIGMFIGGLLIAPLALLEMVISPQMHIFFYGWYPHDFSQTKRGIGWRPSVFMAHGLELAMWNASASFVGWQLFLRGTLSKQVPWLKLPLLPCLIGFTLVLMMSRSSGALMLYIFAMVCYQASVMIRSKLPLLLLFILPVLYMNLRATGAWDGQNLINAAGKLTANPERVGSLSFRLYNEGLLVEKAKLRYTFGWGGYQRSFVTNEKGIFISVPDGMWILTLGKNGIYGLSSLTLCMLLAPFLFLWRMPARGLSDPLIAPAAALASFHSLLMIDDLFNAMHNPVMTLATGGLASLVLLKKPFETDSSRNMLAQSPSQRQVPVTRVI